MTDHACAGCLDIAAELALGIAEGHQRAEALDHLASCPTCRDVVDHLTATADSLVLIAPSVEPPVGFESRVLEHLDRPARVHLVRRRSFRIVSAAAAVVLTLAFGVLVGRAWTGSTVGNAGDPVATAPLTADGGEAVGEVIVHSGDPSLLVVAFPEPGAPPGHYIVECEYRSGKSYVAGSLTIDAGVSGTSWSTTVDARLDNLTVVRLINRDGGPDLEATVRS